MPEDQRQPSAAPYIYRWDMDKTYLATEFDSVKDLIRTALQGPADKANVPGSAVLLRELRSTAGGNALIYFISGSPRQMRGVLSEKLRLDGIHFDGFILKDNLSNLLKGRFKALKEQVGYKLPALLQARQQAHHDSRETLFGDDAERDAFIYSLYSDLLARRVGLDTLEEVFEIAGLYPDSREAILSALDGVPPVDPVDRILIHLERRSPPIRFDPYGPRVAPVYNYFQAALVLFQDGRLPARAVARLATALVERYQFTTRMLLRSFQDTLRRSVLDYEAAARLGAQAQSAGISQEVLDLFAREAEEGNVQPQPRREQMTPDYPQLLARELKRHKIEKSRRKKLGRRFF